MEMTIYSATCRGIALNCRYPNRHVVTTAEELSEAVQFDNVCAKYADDYRSNENFIFSDCLPVDCDNDHTEDAMDWKVPEDVQKEFPDVAFYVIYSKSHEKDKGCRSARPRFHIYFPIDPMDSVEEYHHFKATVLERFPYFDNGAIDGARFFFGVENPKVRYFEGSMKLNQFMGSWQKTQEPPGGGEIYEGERNNTLSRKAGKLLLRFGDCEEAKRKFLQEAAKCVPPLEKSELSAIWKSAQKFQKRIAQSDTYIAPEVYNAELEYYPTDFSDTAQAVLFAFHNRDRLAYSPSTGFLVYDGVQWEESKSKPREVYHDFSTGQIREARMQLVKGDKMMEDSGADSVLKVSSRKKAIENFNDRQEVAYMNKGKAEAYYRFAIKRRNSNYVSATLKETEPMVEIDPAVLDEDPFLLNTPDCTIDLRHGLDGAREHRAADMLTRCTLVAPGEEGRELWNEALDTFFGKDDDLKRYVQEIAGLALIGNVYVEALIIAYGSGRNGKSTFWNTLLRVIGSYGGNISAEVLTTGSRQNIKPELAEIRGKRLLIAAELEEGTRLSTSAVKKFCSTDEIVGEKKFLNPLSFRPSHTLVLYTNHLPKVGANDPGTWRRLIVVPFTQTITGNSDIKNYADYLVENAGPYILKWMIEGAQRVIESKFHIRKPICVEDATEVYREDSDWFEHFVSECCEVGKEYSVPSGEFYQTYRKFCQYSGDYIRSSADFYSAIENAGYRRTRNKDGRFIRGIRLKSEFEQLL